MKSYLRLDAMLSARSIAVFRLLFFLFPLFFLTIKGATNTAGILILAFCLIKFIAEPQLYLLRRHRAIYLISLLLMMPFLCELATQFLRGEVVWSYVDGPARSLIGVAIFLYITASRDLSCIVYFSLGAAFSIIILLLSVIFFPYDWVGKTATYFVDPLSLGVYTLVLLSISYLVFELKLLPKWIFLFLVAGVVFIVLGTESRTAWFSGTLLLALFARKLYSGSSLRASVLLLPLVLVLSYSCVPTISKRVDTTSESFQRLLSGDLNTSFGVRYGLFLFDYDLLTMRPLLGWADGNLPDYDIASKRIPELTPRIYETKRLAGSHSEFSAQLVRKGLLFGGLTLLAIFALPPVILRRLSKKTTFERSCAYTFHLTLCVFIISSIFIQTLNLKMCSTFFSVFLGCFMSILPIPPLAVVDSGVGNATRYKE